MSSLARLRSRQKQVKLFQKVLAHCTRVHEACMKSGGTTRPLDDLFESLEVGKYGGLSYPGSVLRTSDMAVLRAFIAAHGIRKLLFVGCGSGAVESLVSMMIADDLHCIYTDISCDDASTTVVDVERLSVVDAVSKHCACDALKRVLVICMRPTPTNYGPSQQGFCPLGQLDAAGLVLPFYAQYGEISPTVDELKHVFDFDFEGGCDDHMIRAVTKNHTSDSDPIEDLRVISKHCYDVSYTELRRCDTTATMALPCGPDVPLFCRWHLLALPSSSAATSFVNLPREPTYLRRLTSFVVSTVFWIVHDSMNRPPTEYKSLQSFIAWSCLFTWEASGIASSGCIKDPCVGITKVVVKFDKTTDAVKLQFIDILCDDAAQFVDVLESFWALTKKIRIAVATTENQSCKLTSELSSRTTTNWRKLETSSKGLFFMLCNH